MTRADLRQSTTQQEQGHHPAFTSIRSEFIPSLNIEIQQYQHRKTGAMHFHLASDNPENVFLVAFRTVPMDSTGVAHILEHTALCGSKKYPVRDPFFMMIRRSLNTFMNAFTSSDWTAYPFASKNRKDFDNLLQVYLDAAFFSRLDELDFAQEGHRLEFAEPENPDSELQYKGVVFNEMKGAMSSTNSVLWHTICSHLFPTTTYHYNSGGEPRDIPSLSYQNLLDFYKSHYHPSNAVFMTFGDIPASEHHQRFEELALSQFSALDNKISVGDEQRYTTPIKVEESYVSEASDNPKTHVVVGWLLDKSTDLTELFEAQLLCGVLLDNSASPLLRALETSELGQSPSPMCGLEDSNREMSFMAGLEGCERTATELVETLVLETLQNIAAEGVPHEQVEAALHQLELSQREISGDSYPYGLQLILTGLSAAVHDGDPIELLNIDPVLDQLRQRISDDNYIPSLIQRMLLDNPHRVTLTLQPDAELGQQRVDEEKQKLAQIRSQLSADDEARLIDRARALSERQALKDNPEILPKVTLKDVPARMTEPESQASTIGQSKLSASLFQQGTNGLAYQQIVFELPNLPADQLAVLPLYTSCLPELGVGDRDYAEVQNWQAGICGGINSFSSIRSHMDNEQQFHAKLTFSSRALVDNHAALTELLHTTLHKIRFDEHQRLRELVEQICARKENSITGQGHSLAMNLASSRMSPTAQLSHCFGGLEGIRRLQNWRDLMREQTNVEDLLQRLQQIHAQVISGVPEFLLVAEPQFAETVRGDINSVWKNWQQPETRASSLQLPPLRENLCEAWTTTTQVSFCAKSFATVASSHPDNAVLHVLAGFLRNGFLHRAIREQGGAYGGGASQDANSASFRFFSYRDPRLTETLDDFDRAIEWVISDKHEERLLEEAVLGVIATLDKPSSPAGEAKQAFYNRLFGRTLEARMAFREQVLATNIRDLRRVAERYLTPKNCSIGLICNPTMAESLEIPGLVIENIN